MTAFYDFFRYIKLYSTDGTTLEATLEADAVTDSLNISRGNGVAFTGANAGTDSFKIDVDYDLTVPVSTTSLRLSDVNGNNKDIALVAGGNMTITRNSSGQLTIAALVGGVSKSISAITQGNPARVTTTNAHGFTEGTPVTIVDVVGMTNLNGNEYFMDVIDSTNFDLYTDELLSTGVNSTSYPAYTSGGVATANYGGAKQAFKTIRVSGQSDIEADTIADLLTLVGGTGIDITTNAGTDTVTYAIDSSVATLNDTQILTNKTINASNNTLSNIANSSLTNSSITFARVGGNSTAASLGDTVSFQGTASEVTVGENSGTFTIGLPANVAITTGLTVNSDTATTNTASQTLTNKTIDLTDNTVTGTLAEFSTAVSDATLVSTTGTETLTNKTLTNPSIGGATMTAALVLDYTSVATTIASTGQISTVGGAPSLIGDTGNVVLDGNNGIVLSVASAQQVNVLDGKIAFIDSNSLEWTNITSTYDYTINPPASIAASRTLTLPDATGTVAETV